MKGRRIRIEWWRWDEEDEVLRDEGRKVKGAEGEQRERK